MDVTKTTELGILLSVCVHCLLAQTFPYISFNGQTLPNHSYVNISLVGSNASGSDSVQCHTDLNTCCSGAQGSHRGDWYFPNGTRLPFPGSGTTMYEDRGAQRVGIFRLNSNIDLSGIYRCDIPTNAVHGDTDTSVRATAYVGLYPSSGGDITMPESIKYHNLTLTCNSSGGPATNVTWTRNSEQITTGESRTVLVNPVEAQYEHILTITENIGGNYTCIVENNKPSCNSSSLIVKVANAPQHISLVQNNESSINVTWDPPNPPGNTTGYKVFYRQGTMIKSKTVTNASSTFTVLNDLQPGRTYNVSVAGLSDHLPSDIVTSAIFLAALPKNIDVTFTTTSTEISLMVSFDNYSPIAGYTITVTWESLAHSCSHVASVSDSETYYAYVPMMEYTITGLDANSLYSITVLIRNPAGNVTSHPINATTQEKEPSSPPQLIKADAETFSITVSWNPVHCSHQHGRITGYVVKYRKYTSNATLTKRTEALELKITDLQPSTSYDIQVGAENSAGIGVNGSITPMPKTKPFEVFMISKTSSSIELGWSQVDYNTTRTVIVMWEAKTCVNYYGNQSTGLKDLSYVISALEEYTSYIITVCVEEIPSARHSVTVTTDEEAPSAAPVNLTVVSKTAYSITIEWDPVPCVYQNGLITGYIIHYSSQRDDREISIANTTTFEITGLKPDMEYEVEVAAFNVEGRGPFTSTFLEVNTTEDSSVTPDPTNSTTMTPSSPESPTSHTTEDDIRKRSGDIGGAVGGVVVSILIIIATTVGIIAVIWLLRRKKSTLFPVGHFRVLYKQSTMPDSKDMSMDQISIGESLADPEVSCEAETVGIAPDSTLLQSQNGATSDGTSQQQAAEEDKLSSPVVRETEGEIEKTGDGGESESAPESPVKEPPKTLPLPVALFGAHVEKNHTNSNKLFKTEFEALSDGEGKSVAIARSLENRRKNRFANISVYDENRVILSPLGDLINDYINASHVDGYTRPKKFIAAQGPVPSSIVDFWRMVWQEKVPSVVMITNLVEGKKTKCEQYWPSSGSQDFGPFHVSITHQLILADYTIRILSVELSGKTRKVTHFHYTAWPDHGVPDYATSILNFHKMVMKDHKAHRGPLIVHCSAGVGRTGTFITIDHVLEQRETEGVVDVPGAILKLRQQRTNMVQTLDQYIFIHDAILESVTCGDTEIEAGDLRKRLAQLKTRDESGRSGLDLQFAILDQVSSNVGEAKSFAAQINLAKNRSTDFLPVDKWRVVLKGENPDYIHASSVHGYKKHRAFIITQGPMRSTARDFWKMVYSRKCSVVVMLSDLMELDEEVCYQYWPGKRAQTYGEFRVELLSEGWKSGFLFRNFSVQQAKFATAHQVWQFHIPEWSSDYQWCGDVNAMVSVIEEVSKVQRKTGNHPIVVHGLDTVSRSAIFCGVATTIERCKTEGVVDVFQVVKAMRVQKPGAIQTVEQYQSIYEALLVFIDSFETYSNFTT